MRKIEIALAAMILAFTLGIMANSDSSVTKLKIATKGSEIAFDKKKLEAKKGLVEITFTNTSSPDAEMPHNFILLKPGANTDEIGAAGMKAGPSQNFVPDSPSIIKGTSVLLAGKSETITVDLDLGVYPYVCTYPGHAALMKGVLTVK